MIEHLRKYTVLIIVVLALIFVGLTFLNKSSARGGGEDPVVLTVNGTSLTYAQFLKLDERNGQKFIGAVYQSRFMQLFQQLYYQNQIFKTMSEMVLDQKTAAVTSTLLKRQAAEDFGIQPSDEEVTDAVKSFCSSGRDGQFDQEGYNHFVQQTLPKSFNMGEADLREIVRDILIEERLRVVIGGGLSMGAQYERDATEASAQRMTTQSIKLLRATYEKDIHPSDDELKADWETEKAAHMTAKKLKISYVLAAPVYPEAPKPDEPLPPTATEEEKKADAAKKAILATAEAEQKRKVKRETVAKVSALLEGIEKSGANFEALAKEQGLEIKTTDLFSLDALPPELKDLRPRDLPSPSLAAALAGLSIEGAHASPFTGSVALDSDRFLIAHAEEIQEPREKTFEEAKDEMLTRYVAKHAGEAVKKDADEKVAKIREAMAAGKSFADAAKDLSLEVTSHGPFAAPAQSPYGPPAPDVNHFVALEAVDPGTLADPIIEPEGADIVFVEKREIYKDPARDQEIEQAGRSDSRDAGSSAFNGWLLQRHQEAKIVSHFK